MGTPLRGKDFVMLMERSGNMIPVCCGRDLTITITSDTIEATKAPTSRWRSFLYGDSTFTLATTGVVIVGDSFTIIDFFNAIKNKTPLAFVCQATEEHDVFFSGSLLLTSMEVSGSYKDVMTYSIQAQGDGVLNIDNPYEINLLTDENGNPIEDGDGNMIYDQDSGNLLPIDLDINC